jgi:hypothetical protein
MSGLNVEDEFATAISGIGGRRVVDALGRTHEENADFVFSAEGFVAELKCLDEDKILDDRIIEKASRLYLDELNANRAPGIAFGTVKMSTQGFSDEFRKKIVELYRVPIARLFRKAERQIASTLNAAGFAEGKGILLVANNNHTALDPWHLGYIANEILRADSYAHIHTVVVFAGNLTSGLAGSPARIDYWIEIPGVGHKKIEAVFLARLREAWYAHVGKLFGIDIHQMVESDFETLARLESRKW